MASRAQRRRSKKQSPCNDGGGPHGDMSTADSEIDFSEIEDSTSEDSTASPSNTGSNTRRDSRTKDMASDELTPRAAFLLRYRRRWWLLMPLGCVLLLVWFAPALVAHSGILRWIVGTATADLHGSVSIGSASLGWLSPVVVEDVEIQDSQGNSVASLPRAKTDRSLATLLMNLAVLGEVTIEQPKLDLVLRDDGSNLEDLLAEYLAEPADPDSQGVQLKLTIVDGTVTVHDVSVARQWQLDKLSLNVELPGNESQPTLVDAAVTLVEPDRSVPLAARVVIPPATADTSTDTADTPSSGQLALKTDAMPLAIFRPLLARFIDGTRLDGRLSADVTLNFGDTVSGQGQVTASGLELTTPALGNDRVHLDALQLTGAAAQQGDLVELRNVQLLCDVGQLTASGRLNLAEDLAGDWTAALRQAVNVNGRLDLAHVAQMLPETLHIREGLNVTSAQLTLELASQPNPDDPQHMQWQGHLTTSDVVATHQGTQIAWQQPINLTLTAHDAATGPVVDDLKCNSNFLKLHAAGTLDNLAASLNFSLDQLSRELGKFIDLQGVTLSGDGRGYFSFKRGAPQQAAPRPFETDLELQLTDLVVQLPEKPQLTERNVVAFFSAAGLSDLADDTRIDKVSLEINTAVDSIKAQLAQPVGEVNKTTVWPVTLAVKGQFENWRPRLAVFMDVSTWQATGAYTLSAEADGSMSNVAVRNARLAVGPFRVQTSSLVIDEPGAELTANATWDGSSRRITVGPAQLTSSTLAAQAQEVVVAMAQQPGEGPQASGTVKLQANLSRLSRWFVDPNQPASWQVAGHLDGALVLKQHDDTIEGQLGANVTNLAFANSAGEQFQEPAVQLVAQGSYTHGDRLLLLEKAELTSATAGLSATAQVVPGSETAPVDVRGQLTYDWPRVLAMLRPYVGQEVQVTGRASSPISYAGPFDVVTGTGRVAIDWQSANVYGFQIGPAQVKTVLDGGLLRIEPVDLNVSQGRMHLAPTVHLDSPSKELTMPAGPLVSQVQISPKMCDAFLKYIAPVLADVTSAQGAFSIELEGCRVPLDDPAKGDVAGRFIIHSVEVGPGPLVQEFSVLLGNVAPAKLKQESVVPFRMVDGRVYHQNLELVFPDLTIRTYGSVGFDQTLALMAEMPVPPKWLGKDNTVVASAMRDQTIRLPVAGTLSKPKLDRREMDRQSRQFIEKAVGNVIEDELRKGLNGLFRSSQ